MNFTFILLLHCWLCGRPLGGFPRGLTSLSLWHPQSSQPQSRWAGTLWLGTFADWSCSGQRAALGVFLSDSTFGKERIKKSRTSNTKNKFATWKAHRTRTQSAQTLSRKCSLTDWTSSLHVTRDLNHKTAHPTRRLRLPTEPFLPAPPTGPRRPTSPVTHWTWSTVEH